jgi:hypothetical protein
MVQSKLTRSSKASPSGRGAHLKSPPPSSTSAAANPTPQRVDPTILSPTPQGLVTGIPGQSDTIVPDGRLTPIEDRKLPALEHVPLPLSTSGSADNSEASPTPSFRARLSQWEHKDPSYTEHTPSPMSASSVGTQSTSSFSKSKHPASGGSTSPLQPVAPELTSLQPTGLALSGPPKVRREPLADLEADSFTGNASLMNSQTTDSPVAQPSPTTPARPRSPGVSFASTPESSSGIRIVPKKGKERIIDHPAIECVCYCDVTFHNPGAADNYTAYSQLANGVTRLASLLHGAGTQVVIFPYFMEQAARPAFRLPQESIPNYEISKYVVGFPRRSPGPTRVRVLLGFSMEFDRVKQSVQQALRTSQLGLWYRDLQRESTRLLSWMFMSVPNLMDHPTFQSDLEDQLQSTVALTYRTVYGLGTSFTAKALHVEVEASEYRKARSRLRSLYGSKANRPRWPGQVYLLPLPVYEDAKNSRRTLAKCRRLSEVQSKVFNCAASVSDSPVPDLFLSNRDTSTVYDYIMDLKAKDSTDARPQYLFRYVYNTLLVN